MNFPDYLKQDPYMLAAKSSRSERMADEKTPIYHYVCSHSYMNDPNGLCYYQGNWHLFYQLIQTETNTWTWGHAISTDLVHWTELPLAITPNDPENGEASSWSGATCVRPDRVVAMYYGYGGKCGLYCQTATDPLLLDWKRIGKGPAVACGRMDEAEYTRVPYAVAPAVYDSCIWFEDDTYWALSGGVTRLGGESFIRQEYLYSSSNLTDWHYEHPFLRDDHFGSAFDDGACPYFVKLGTEPGLHLLLTYSHCNGPEYMIGMLEKPEMVFVPKGGFRLNPCSKDGGYAAPTAFADPSNDGSVRAFYIMHAAGGLSCMSLPHTITPDEKGCGIAVAPAKELESLRKNHRRAENIDLPANTETVIDIAKGNHVEIDMTVSVEPQVAVEFRCLRSEDGAFYTAFSLYSAHGSMLRDDDDWHRGCVLNMDASHSSTAPWLPAPESISFPKKDGQPVRLRVFIDGSVVEVFTLTGQSLGRRVLPDGTPDTFSVIARSGNGTITQMDVWDMEDINSAASTID